MDLTLGTKVRVKRSFEGDARHGARRKRQKVEIPLSPSFIFKDSDVSDGSETEGTIADDHAVKENIRPPPPSPAGTVDSNTTLEHHPLELDRALLQIAPKPTITEARVRKNGVLVFVAGFKSPVWVLYDQVRDNDNVRAFLKILRRSQWKAFVMEREKRRREPAFLGCGSFGKQMEVKRWDGQWMFKVKATGLLLDEEGVRRMGLVDDAAEFLYQNSGEAQVVD